MGGSGNDVLLGGGGADVFVFARGGDHDVVRDFRNDVDVVELRGFGLADIGAAMDAARQSGDDVTFDFGDGHRLTIEDARLGWMVDDLVLA